MNHDIASRFRAIAGQFPDQAAITYCQLGDQGKGKLTYAQLQLRSRQIAAALAAEHGVTAGDRVGLIEAADPEVIAAMIALASIGAAYVPIDGELPPDRIRSLVADAGLRVCLTAGADREAAANADDVKTLLLPELGQHLQGRHILDPRPPPDDVALYVMYTSGSTGQPKGVVVPHRAVYRLVINPDFIAPGPDMRFLHMAPQSFDASTLEIWAPLLNGGTCVIYPGPLPDPDVVEQVVKSFAVNTMWLTSALFNRFVAQWPAAIEGVSTLLFGGERASLPHVQTAFQQQRDRVLINGYGPTENTTFTTCHRIAADDFAPGKTELPIGRPISGTTIRIVDDELNDVADGTWGELLAGGDGLAQGYLNRPELSSSRFITAADGLRWYRTGDLVSRQPDGVIHFHGRLDRQMKLDGHRIEPGEIEMALLQEPTISQAVVTLVQAHGGARKLVAYLVGSFVESGLRTRLGTLLPQYMVPSVFVAMDELPTNVNGKVDTGRLPDPFASETEQAGDGGGDSCAGGQAPASLEEQIAAIWCQSVAGMAPPEITDNFFDAGGSSLDMLTVKEKLNAVLGLDVAVVSLFRYPTIEKLAAFLNEGASGGENQKTAAHERANQRKRMLRQRRDQRSLDG